MLPMLAGVAGLGLGSFFGAQVDDALDDEPLLIAPAVEGRLPFFSGVNKTVLLIVGAGLFVAYLKYKKK